MTENEANQCVAYLGRLFPMMTRDADRLMAIRNTFLPLSEAEVRRAIDSRVGVDQFPDIPAIVAWCTPPAAAKRNPLAGGTYRINGLTTHERQQQQAIDAAVKAKRQRDLDAVAKLDPATAERLKRQAIAAMQPELRPIYERRPLLQSPPLVHAVAALACGKA